MKVKTRIKKQLLIAVTLTIMLSLSLQPAVASENEELTAITFSEIRYDLETTVDETYPAGFMNILMHHYIDRGFSELQSQGIGPDTTIEDLAKIDLPGLSIPSFIHLNIWSSIDAEIYGFYNNQLSAGNVSIPAHSWAGIGTLHTWHDTFPTFWNKKTVFASVGTVIGFEGDFNESTFTFLNITGFEMQGESKFTLAFGPTF